jgi:hypothetical protein
METYLSRNIPAELWLHSSSTSFGTDEFVRFSCISVPTLLLFSVNLRSYLCLYLYLYLFPRFVGCCLWFGAGATVIEGVAACAHRS